MHLVILDGYTLNPGDLSWESLKALGKCAFYKRTPPGKIIKRSIDADILLINKVVIDKNIISCLPRLKHICVLATGYNVVDTVFARKQNVSVSNIPAYSTESVAQTVFSFLLETISQVGSLSRKVINGKWSKSKDFCFYNHPLLELKDLTLGVIGYGKTGRPIIKKARAFEMNLRVFTRTIPKKALRIQL
jgi:glycerate dehydrogenase